MNFGCSGCYYRSDLHVSAHIVACQCGCHLPARGRSPAALSTLQAHFLGVSILTEPSYRRASRAITCSTGRGVIAPTSRNSAVAVFGLEHCFSKDVNTHTVFLHVEPSDSFGHVKRQVAEILEVDPNNILFYAPDKSRELPDLATIVDQDIKNDAILYMVFRKGGGDSWEEIDVPSHEMDAGGGGQKKA